MNCSDPKGTVPRCDDFCALNLNVCTGQFQFYKDAAECKAVCEVLDVGVSEHTVEDTVGCRIYHTYSAISSPDTHCKHASPGGDGHCGKTNCPAYCKIMEKACPTEYAGTLGGSQTACEAACTPLAGSAEDTITTVAETGDTLRCRLTAAAAALIDNTNCAAAAGGGTCAP